MAAATSFVFAEFPERCLEARLRSAWVVSEAVDRNLVDYPALVPPQIVAMEEVIPRAIKSQESTEYVVALVLTVVICLTLVVVAWTLPTKIILP
jgi:uncharacterized membrane protein YdbT with pleckstrin-like domain